jgi:PTS system fructose-specific IIA component/PTS system nitrogen regulatory IIA component
MTPVGDTRVEGAAVAADEKNAPVTRPRPVGPVSRHALDGGAGMRLCEFVVRKAILPNLAAIAKEAAIREMVESLRAAESFRGTDIEDIVRAILKREFLGSTGIGRGVAIPHTKHPGVDRLVGTIAVSHQDKGVAFESLDGEPVYVLVLLISPQDRPGDHLRALENVSRALRDDNFVKALRAATTREEISALLDSCGH